MGTKGIEIVDADVDDIITLLNKALADEWLAYYQYWIGSKVAKGPMRGALVAELIEHADDELRHADMLVERITQLGGTPLLAPEAWYEFTNCGYEAPTHPHVMALLDQNIQGEQCAIEVYRDLAEKTRESDSLTYEIVLEILGDEVEHEEDLQALVEDIELMRQRR